jgi:hypothetical protein
MGGPEVAGASAEGVSLGNEDWPEALWRPPGTVRSYLRVTFISSPLFHIMFL